MLEIGLRAIRGPDWKWGNQDDGEGHVGTVVEIGKAGSVSSPDKTVVVQWDSGARTNYRVGYQNAYDLRIYDNAPVGVKHQNIICDGCRRRGTHGILGMRWQCLSCHDYDLCTQCYMNNVHDLSHIFQRFVTANSIGIKVPPRIDARKIVTHGIFVGAKVVRGPDWDWGNQDGGEGNAGRVTDIRGWDSESGRSVANVTWTNGVTNVYRVGHKGKVDLKYIQDASPGSCYRDHLPVLGHSVEQHVAVGGRETGGTQPAFNVGDKVKVILDVERLKVVQVGHGGWNPWMEEYIDKVGTVHRVTDKGDIRVQYEQCQNRWTFHPQALVKILTFAVNDYVKVIDDVNKVKEYQKFHGEWVDIMRGALGKIGKVIKVYSDGDLRVTVDGQTWTFSPLCVNLVPGSAADINNSMHTHEREEHASPLASLLPHLMDVHLEPSLGDKLVKEAAMGHTEKVREIVAQWQEKVDQKSSGKTCLQVAAHQGHLEIIRILLQAGASLEVVDDDGDTALHYSAFGNQPDTLEFLLKKDANIDAVNKLRNTTLHVAVSKQYEDCVRILLRHKCSVNIQDSYGDTPLHDAIGKESMEILNMLVSVANIDFSLCNRRGFNVLHHAALKGNVPATERLLARSRQMVDVKKDDGFAALHLASLNGHRRVAEMLIVRGMADINIQNNRKQTALILSVNQGYCSLIELLVSHGTNINAEDEDGNTALHVALNKLGSKVETSEITCPQIHALSLHLADERFVNCCDLALCCFLAEKGANLMHKNSKHETPLDLTPDSNVAELLQSYSEKQRSSDESTADEPAEQVECSSGAPKPNMKVDDLVECMVCSEVTTRKLLFHPCGHQVVCIECGTKMKKCIMCKVVITEKINPAEQPKKPKGPPLERLKMLENEVTELNEVLLCQICMERRKNIVFLCGHGACSKCAEPLRVCHMCRKQITKKINTY